MNVMFAPMTPCSTVPMAAIEVDEPSVTAIGIAMGRVMNRGDRPNPTCAHGRASQVGSDLI